MFVKGDRKANFTPIQFYLDRDLDVTAAETIVSVSATARTLEIEPMQGEARIGYRVTYKVIYTSGEDFASFEDSYEYTAEIKSADITPKSFVDATASVIATEFVGVSRLKVRLMLEIKGYVIVCSGFETMESTEGLCVKTASVKVEHIEPLTGGEILVEGTERINDKVDRVLTADSVVCVNSVSTATEICEIKGVCYTYLIYLSDGKIGYGTLSAPFEAQILAPAVTEKDSAYFTPTVVSTGVSVTDTDQGAEVKTETVISVKGFAVSVAEAEIVVDAYSKENEIKLEYAHAVVEDNECVISSHEKFVGALPVDAGEAGMRNLLFIGAPWIGACNARYEDGLIVEGIVGAEIVYADNDGKTGRALAEIPYRFVFGGDFACRSSVTASAVVTSVNARIRPGDTVELSGELCVEIHGSGDREIRYVASYEVVAPKEISDAAISLYLVGEGETLFDVAKELNSDEEELMALNPELELPLKRGDKVLLYKPLD